MTAIGMALGWAPLAVYLPAIGASMAITLIRPAQNALLPGLARTPEELTAGNAVASIAEAGGLLLGPLVAAAVLAVGTPAAVLGLLTAVACVAALLVVRLAPRPSPDPCQEHHGRGPRAGGAGPP